MLNMLIAVFIDLTFGLIVNIMDKSKILLDFETLFQHLGVTDAYNHIIAFTSLSPSILINAIIF